MSDLSATNCGNNCDCGNNSCNLIFLILLLSCICGHDSRNGFGFFGDNMGCCSWLWILLLFGCCGNGNGFGCGC